MSGIHFLFRNSSDDLEKCILYPQNSPNFLFNVIRFGILSISLFRKSMKSSAYKDILCSSSPVLMPARPLWALTAIARGSIANMNSISDSGQPSRVEHCKLNGFETKLLVRISAAGFV